MTTVKNRYVSWLVLVVLIVIVSACDKKSPTTPTPSPTPTPTPTTFTVSGTVTDGSSPLPGASVRITGGTGANIGKNATTDAAGRYSITGVSPERIIMETTIAGYAIGTASPTVAANTTQDFALTRLTFTISGTVTDATSGGVLPNILIKITGGTSLNFGKSATTDGAGKYTITGVVAERIVLEASNAAYEVSAASPTVTGNTTVDFILVRQAPTTGNLIFKIDAASCGTTPSSPIVDVFIDGNNVGTIYNVTTPNSQISRTVSTGMHTVEVNGSRGAAYPLTNLNIGTGVAVTITLSCTS